MAVSSTNTHTSTHSDPFINPMMEEMEDENFDFQESSSSERKKLISKGLDTTGEVETPPKKIAYIWLEAKADDPALSTEDRKRERELNIELLENIGYEVKFFDSGRKFFDAIQKAKHNHEEVDMIVFSQHGNPTQCGNFHVKEEQIISKDPHLTPDEQQHGFEYIQEVMAKDSVVIFNSCATGNKSVTNNIGKVASQVLSNSTVFAPQSKIALDPMYGFKKDDKKGVVVNSVQFTIPDEDFIALPYIPAQYVNGKDVTEQEVEPYTVRQPKRWRLAKVANAVALGAMTVLSGLGAWYYTQNMSP